MCEKKICKQCGEEKNISEFSKKYKTKVGIQKYQPVCRTCVSEYGKEYRPKHHDKIIEYSKTYYKENREQLLENKKEYHIKNREVILENHRIYRQDTEHKEQAKEYRKNYFKNHKDKVYAYRKRNPHIIAWRNILYRSLRYLGKEKENHTDTEIGYTAIELRNHLTSLFREGMSWDNFGEWEIDHIKPLTAFNIDALPSEVNALSNLQPLWKEENIAKYNHWDGDENIEKLSDEELENEINNMSDDEFDELINDSGETISTNNNIDDDILHIK